MSKKISTRGISFSVFASMLSIGACLSAPAPVPSMAGTGGVTSNSGGANGSGGIGAGSGGSNGTGGNGSGSGGSNGTGGNNSGTGGQDQNGTGGGMASGGSGPGTGGSVVGSGGNGSGGVGTGGSVGTGGTVATGGMTGAGGATDLKALASTVNGLRLDDVCGTLGSSNTCLHITNNDSLPYMANKAVTMGGTVGTTYLVKIHVYGVVEATHISGGTAGMPVQFKTGGNDYAAGSEPDAYNQWRITTSTPNQHYWVNSYDSVTLAHKVYLLDYSETIQIGGGATVTLDVHDGNGHLISNTASPVLVPPAASPTVAGSMKSGQFVELRVESVTAM